MDREDWMYAKAMGPGLLLMGLAALALWALWGLLNGSDLGNGLFAVWRWGAAGLMGVGFLTMCWRSLRVHQALNGVGPMCPHCHGPLGGESNGRYGPYRKCMSCNRNIAQRNY